MSSSSAHHPISSYPAHLLTQLTAQGEVATFASGCFWGTEHIFLKDYKNKGIIKTTVGYTGGDDNVKNPSYKDVCTGRTGHAEACKVEFDPEVLPYEELVGACLLSHGVTLVWP